MRRSITLAGMRCVDGRIKSIQRGVIAIAGAASATATITAVHLRHARLRFLGYTNSTDDAVNMIARVELTDETTVTALRYATVAAGTSVGWEVTEYWPGVIKSVQRGSVALSASPQNVTLAAVNSKRAEVHLLGWRGNAAGTGVTYLWHYAQLTTDTNLALSAGAVGGYDAGYEVTEFWE